MERDRESVYGLSEQLCLACLRRTGSRSSNLIDDRDDGFGKNPGSHEFGNLGQDCNSIDCFGGKFTISPLINLIVRLLNTVETSIFRVSFCFSVLLSC